MNSLDALIDVTFRIGRLMRRQATAFHGKNTNFLQIHALLFISERDGLTMKQLAECLLVKSPTATTFVDRLVKQQLVQRVSDAKNRKLVRLKITPKGKALLKKKLEERKRMMRAFFEPIPEQDRKELVRILSGFVTSSSL